MASLRLFGPAYSVYTRIVRVVLAEKGIAYTLEEVDFISSGMPAAQKERHPFGLVPALQNNGDMFFEAGPICVYLDQVWPIPPLSPSDPVTYARMASTISVLDAYIWPDIRELVTQATFSPLVGGWPDESVTERMIKRLKSSLRVLDEKFVGVGMLDGAHVTLADLHAAPMLAYLAESLEGQVLLQDCPVLSAWWQQIKDRPSLLATEFDLLSYPWARREEGR